MPRVKVLSMVSVLCSLTRNNSLHDRLGTVISGLIAANASEETGFIGVAPQVSFDRPRFKVARFIIHLYRQRSGVSLFDATHMIR